MSGLDSWEDDPAAQEESNTNTHNLSQQTQNLNINGSQSFRPGATSFQPGAASFQPGQQYQQQFGGYQQQQQYPYNGYQQQQPQPQQQGFPQYNQGYNQGGYNSQGYNQSYSGGVGGQYAAYSQGPGGFQSRQQQQQPPPQNKPPISIAKRPTKDAVQDSQFTQSQPTDASAPKAKVLSIGGDAAKPKPATTAAAPKVLSIGVPSSTASAKTTGSPTTNEAPPVDDGSKVTATKAIEKTGEKTAAGATGKTSSPPSSGKSSPTPGEKKAAARTADQVAQEQTADVDEQTLEEIYGKEHVNLIFIGHVDAGKSTLGGSILYATGMVDERTMEKYKKESKDAGRESWYLSWALDLTKEERSKGKTVEVGRGFFETDKRRYTILDAPGHKTFVPNMIGGASQADIGILVISSRKGEYETGFEKGGQTREHAILAKTQGVNKLVIVVNKMDDPTVEWSKARYDECIIKLTAFLKGVGYNPKTDLMFMPISAQTTVGIRDRVPKDLAPWYSGPSLLEYLDNMDKLERKVNAPFMMPVGGKYRDMGTMIEGRIESGVVKKSMTYIMMPNREETTITALYGETEEEIAAATCGDQVRLRLRGVEEEDILPGFVLCSPKRPVHCVRAFEAQIVVLELKSILSAGFNCVMHVHAAIEEVTFADLLHKLEKGTGRKSKRKPPFAQRGMSIIARLEILGAAAVCVERFEDYPQMGRFTLRDQVRCRCRLRYVLLVLSMTL